jgi:uncharacterized membrane protein YcaP (DUF421 family)
MEIVYRAAFIFGFLWLITRVTGRTTLGELSTFQLLLYVTMGDLVQQAVTQQDYSVTAAVLAVSVFGLLTVLISWLSMRFPRVRPVTHGKPVVVVENGEPLMDNMRAERLAMDNLLAAARENGIERFAQIRLAVLEVNGKISFFTEEGAQEGAPEGPTVG